MTTTADVLAHHIESMGAGDGEAILSDYADDATLLTPNGVFNGISDIKAFFDGFMTQLPPDFITNLVLDVNEVDGEYAYIVWHSGDAAPLGTDTFHIVDGKIAMQSFAAYMPS
ncbi:MAG: nuclear transport factor 2 family protein [Chloroflexi bacterium]|nr:nuclear transport factor 2 family protein [Chloroflexota bacterium]